MEIHAAVATGWEWAAAQQRSSWSLQRYWVFSVGTIWSKKEVYTNYKKKKNLYQHKKAKIITPVMQHSLGQSLHWEWIKNKTCDESSWFIQSMKLLCHVSRTKRTLASVWSFQLQQNICPSFLNIRVSGRKGQIRITTGIVLASDPGWVEQFEPLNHHFFVMWRDERSWQGWSKTTVRVPKTKPQKSYSPLDWLE